MGIQISAVLIYGCYYSELPEEVLDEVNEMLDDGRLDYASPYYDSSKSEWIVGFELPAYGHSLSEIGSSIAKLKENNRHCLWFENDERFPFMTLWAVPHVY